MCIDSGAFRSACPIRHKPDVSAKGTAQPLFSTDVSPVEQRGYKKVHWEKKRIGSTMVSQVCWFLL